MKILNRYLCALAVPLLLCGCGGSSGGSSSSAPPPATPPPAPAAHNELAITVNGTSCLNNSYSNKPCASVTICSPGTSNCQTIDGILLDTGSYGLRIFKQALTNIPLTQVTNSSGVSVAECIQFGDGSSLWGPVQTAGVVLGGEPAVQVPVQVIDATFGTPPAACSNAGTSPQAAGINGILGVGVLDQDCGSACVKNSDIGIYFACTGASCSGSTVSLASQVRNPVALLPTDNNGVIIRLPAVPPSGASFLNGTMLLGIGTQTNNTLSGVTTYATNPAGEFTTVFNGVTQSHSFIDTGSNMLFFDNAPASLPACPAPNGQFYCPPATTTLSATNSSASGSPSGAVSFQIANFNSLLATSNQVFSNMGGNLFGNINSGTFDWGLPFFLGRNVAVGLAGTSSNLGTGPYWAY
ncbi:MAG: DUF3443 domain-containing protein [Geobacteraceae bacterium]|nr:DUF3443 domain-containing protein [Geobacteraceae bacterium]